MDYTLRVRIMQPYFGTITVTAKTFDDACREAALRVKEEGVECIENLEGSECYEGSPVECYAYETSEEIDGEDFFEPDTSPNLGEC